MSHGNVVTGARKTCLADAVAMAMDVDNDPVREFIGVDYTWRRADQCVQTFQPGWALVSANKSLKQPGGLELTLLKMTLGKYVLMMSYSQDDIKYYHCAFFDSGYEWKIETHDQGWVTGRGVLKDNQADVGVHLTEDVDRESTASARAFFQGPYKIAMRIESVYLMTKVVNDDEKASCDRNDNDGRSYESDSSDDDDDDDSNQGESSDEDDDDDSSYEYFHSSSSSGECCNCSNRGPKGLPCDGPGCEDSGGTFQGKWVAFPKVE
jgi:hypothetical protein